MLLNLIFLALLVACLLWIFILYWNSTAESRLVRRRLDRFTGGLDATTVESEDLDDDTRWREMLHKIGQQLTPPQWNRYYERLLLQSGWRIRAPEFMGVMALVALLGGVLGWAWMGLAGAVLFAILFFMLAHMYLKRTIESRAKKFTAQLSDALVLIANSLRSGFSFMQAIELVSREMTPPISREFGRVLNEMNLGASADDALENLTNRVASMELELVVTAVLIQRQVGGNLAEVLDTIAETIRGRARMRREISALTAQGRLSGFVVGILPFAMALYIFAVNREFIMLLWTESIGRAMIAGAILMQILGAFIINKIVTIDL